MLAIKHDDEQIVDDEVDKSESSHQESWKIMIVDDDEEIHRVTRLALQDFRYSEKSLDIISAHSGREAISMIEEHMDTAIILLNVAMEEDDSGLGVVKYIREELGNDSVRIILLTGRPGQVLERKVIVDYDINDCNSKTELTNNKLITTMVTGLRSYQHLQSIEVGRRGLEKIIDASSSILKLPSLEKYISGVLIQLVSLLNLNENSVFCKTTGFAPVYTEEDLRIVGGTGIYEGKVNSRVIDVVSDGTMEDVSYVVNAKRSLFRDDRCTMFFYTKEKGFYIIYLEKSPKMKQWNRHLLDLFYLNIDMAFENVCFFENLAKEL